MKFSNITDSASIEAIKANAGPIFKVLSDMGFPYGISHALVRHRETGRPYIRIGEAEAEILSQTTCDNIPADLLCMPKGLECVELRLGESMAALVGLLHHPKSGKPLLSLVVQLDTQGDYDTLSVEQPLHGRTLGEIIACNDNEAIGYTMDDWEIVTIEGPRDRA